MASRNDPWNDERDADLKRCLADGMTFEETSRFLNRKYGKNYTRSAIGGRAMRIGLQSMNAAYPRRGEPQTQTAARRTAAQKQRHQRERIAAQKRELVKELSIAEVEPLTGNQVGLLDLSPDSCRWPLGGSPFVFCGNPRVNGYSYCAGHVRLSLNRGWVSKDDHRAPVRMKAW